MRNLLLSTATMLALTSFAIPASAAIIPTPIACPATNQCLGQTAIQATPTLAQINSFLFDTSFGAFMQVMDTTSVATAVGISKVSSYAFPASGYPNLPISPSANWYALPLPTTPVIVYKAAGALAAPLQIVAVSPETTWTPPTNANSQPITVTSFSGLDDFFNFVGHFIDFSTSGAAVGVAGGPAAATTSATSIGPYGWLVSVTLTGAAAAAATPRVTLQATFYLRYAYS